MAEGEGRDKVVGTYLVLRLSIENKGRRNSVIRRFDIEVPDLARTFHDMRPEPRNYVQTRAGQQMTGLDVSMSPAITVPAENFVTATLPFYLPDVQPENSSTLELILTLVDTRGVRVDHKVVATKVG